MPLVLVSASGSNSTKAIKPTVMNWPLDDVLEHLSQIEELIEPEEGGEMQAGVEEGKQTQHAAQLDASQFQPLKRRSGVTANAMQRK